MYKLHMTIYIELDTGCKKYKTAPNMHTIFIMACFNCVSCAGILHPFLYIIIISYIFFRIRHPNYSLYNILLN